MEVEEELMSMQVEEEEMEEGELSSDPEDANPRKDMLPDLLQGIGGGSSGGLSSILSSESRVCVSKERLEARAKRFNLADPSPPEDLEILYEGLGVNTKNRSHRLDAIHIVLRKTKRSVLSKDFHAYFGDFSPDSFEWISSNVINVIWGLPSLAAKAMLALSRPLLETSDMEIDVQSGVETEGLNADVVEEKFKEPSNTPIYTNEVGDSIVIPDEGPWRFGKPSEFSSFIFMKFAYRSNGTQKNHHHSSIKHEGIISSSLKRKMRDAMIQEQELRHQQEERKKYLGPVGKNPWGSIAESWSQSRSSRGIECGGSIPVPREVILPSARIKDWDAPDAVDERRGGDHPPPTSSSLAHHRLNKKRKRDSLSMEEDGDLSNQSEGSDDDEQWNSRLKKPRMSMIADKVSAKQMSLRVFQGARRKIEERKSVKILQLDEIEEEEEFRSSGGIHSSKDLRLRLNNAEEVSHNSSSFESRLGSSLRSRLGERSSSRVVERRSRRDSSVSPPPVRRVMGLHSTVVKVEDARHRIRGRKKSYHMDDEVEEEEEPRMNRRGNNDEDDVEESLQRRRRKPRGEVKSLPSKKSSSRHRGSATQRRRRRSSSSESSDSSDSMSSSSSSNSSSSESSSDSSSSSSSDSSDSSSSSYSSSSSEASGRKKSKKYRSKSRRALKKKTTTISSSNNKKASSGKSTGLRDKLKEYLKQAKERKKTK